MGIEYLMDSCISCPTISASLVHDLHFFRILRTIVTPWNLRRMCGISRSICRSTILNMRRATTILAQSTDSPTDWIWRLLIKALKKILCYKNGTFSDFKRTQISKSIMVMGEVKHKKYLQSEIWRGIEKCAWKIIVDARLHKSLERLQNWK